jgi:uncharacterized protein YjbJ (UPF0337 family)
MLSKERLEGNWNSVVGAIREKFGQITGDDLQRVQGDAEQLIGMIQRKTGESREQIESFLNDCVQASNATVNRVSQMAEQYAGVASDAVRENYNRLASEAQRSYAYTVSNMKRRPLESLGIALGAGIVAGLALGLSLASRRR